MIRRLFAVALVVASVALGGCSLINSAIEQNLVIAQCEDGSGNGYPSVVAACTRILNSKNADRALKFTAYLNRGEAYTALHDYRSAIADLVAAHVLDATDDRPLHALSTAELFKGDRKSALADASLALNNHPTAENFAARGEVYDYLEEYAPAVDDFTRAIALDPKNADPYNDRCWSRAKSGKQLDLALADCNTALHLMPDSPAILNSRGYAFYRLGQFPSAIADLNASMKDYPDFASSLYIRGLVEKRIDDAPDAAKDMKKATALDPAVARSVVP